MVNSLEYLSHLKLNYPDEKLDLLICPIVDIYMKILISLTCILCYFCNMHEPVSYIVLD